MFLNLFSIMFSKVLSQNQALSGLVPIECVKVSVELRMFACLPYFQFQTIYKIELFKSRNPVFIDRICSLASYEL